MSSHPAHITAGLLVLVAMCATASWGSDAVPSAAAGAAVGEVPPQLLVLKNGTVIDGRVHVVQGGYEIERNGGRVFLAESYVWYTADSRQEAYKILRERIPYATADSHVRIAEWCVENDLTAAAEEEVRLALRLEPDHEDARALLRVIGGGSTGGGATPTASLDEEETPTLGGLPPETARTFVNRVQPILVNRCGNASCHGAASGRPFTLQNARSGHPSFKTYTHENLDAVLKQVTPDSPLSSPLLVQSRLTGHGGSRRPIFVGRAGEAQIQAIVDWIDEVSKTPAVSADRTDAGESNHLQLTSSTASPKAPSSPQAKNSLPAPSPVYADATGAGATNESPATPGEAPERDATSRLLESVIRNERPDAFDPEAFNRRFAPRSEPSPLSSSEGPMR